MTAPDPRIAIVVEAFWGALEELEDASGRGDWIDRPRIDGQIFMEPVAKAILTALDAGGHVT